MFGRSRTINFNQISIRSRKSGKCIYCGKPCTRWKTFTQTINPFNKKENGDLKSKNDIRLELKCESENWSLEPISHERCEFKSVSVSAR